MRKVLSFMDIFAADSVPCFSFARNLTEGKDFDLVSKNKTRQTEVLMEHFWLAFQKKLVWIPGVITLFFAVFCRKYFRCSGPLEKKFFIDYLFKCFHISTAKSVGGSQSVVLRKSRFEFREKNSCQRFSADLILHVSVAWYSNENKIRIRHLNNF